MNLKNTSRHSDALIHEVIRLACEECGFTRLPVGCQVTIEQGSEVYSTGRAIFSGRTRFRKCGSSGTVRLLSSARATGGRVYVRAARHHKGLSVRGGKAGYLTATCYGSLEDFVYVLAHEVRHVFQGVRPLPRDTRKLRKCHGFGRADLIEVDASRAGIRVLRRWRRQ